MTAQKSKFYNRLLQFLKVSLAKGSPSLSLSRSHYYLSHLLSRSISVSLILFSWIVSSTSYYRLLIDEQTGFESETGLGWAQS